MMNLWEIKKNRRSKKNHFDEFFFFYRLLDFQRQVSATWRPTETIPDDVYVKNYDTELNDDEKQNFDAKTLDDRVSEQATFLTRNNKLIYPELKINQRIVSDSKSKSAGTKPTSKRVFSDVDLQTWYYNKVKNKILFIDFSFE